MPADSGPQEMKVAIGPDVKLNTPTMQQVVEFRTNRPVLVLSFSPIEPARCHALTQDLDAELEAAEHAPSAYQEVNVLYRDA